MNDTTSRREFLRTATGAAMLVTATPLLQACGDGGSSKTSVNPNASTVLPAYVPRQDVKPDLPGLPNGTPPGYRAYPTSPPRLYDKPPATSGRPITLLKMLETPPPAMNKNSYWQELNRRVGAELRMTNFPAQEYISTKLNVTLASNDLPELTQMNRTVPQLEKLLASRFQDLSEWVAGDKIKDYPSLAAIPTAAWAEVAFNGGIYGVPITLGAIGDETQVRLDLFKKKDVKADLSGADGQEFVAACKALTEPAKKHWALENIRTTMKIVSEMVGVPNDWSVANGKFNRAYESEQYKQALDITKQLWSAQVIYPDSLDPQADSSEWFANGTTAITRSGGAPWVYNFYEGVDPELEVDGLVTPKWEGGGQAPHYLRSLLWTFTGLRKTTPERAQELLRVLDWLAAPFGSEEYLFVRFGLPGRHYTLKGTDPVATTAGDTECAQLDVSYIAAPPETVYEPGRPDLLDGHYNYYKKVLQSTVPVPTLGLYSATQFTKGKALDQDMTDLTTDIVTGRKQLSAWDDGVKRWKSNGGDKIRTEYEVSYAKSGPK